MKVATAWAILLTLPALAFVLHRHRAIIVRVGAVIGGLLAAPLAIGLVSLDWPFLRGSVLVALVGGAIYAASLALDRRNLLSREEREAEPSPFEPPFILPKPEPMMMKGAFDLEPVGPRRELQLAESAPLPSALIAAEPLDLAVTGWPDFTKDHAAEPLPSPDPPARPEPEPVAAALPSEPEPVALPVKRGRGRPRKTAAKQASPSPVVKSEPVSEGRTAEIEAAAMAAVAQAALDPAPAPKPEKSAEPATDGRPVASDPVPESAPPQITPKVSTRSWHRPMVHAVPPEPFHLPQPSPAIAARTAAAGAVAAAPERPTASVFEQLLTRPAVIESLSPSGVVRIRIVGWPARILTAYRAAQFAMLLSVFLFYENILHFVGSKIGERIVPFMGGFIGGVFK